MRSLGDLISTDKNVIGRVVSRMQRDVGLIRLSRVVFCDTDGRDFVLRVASPDCERSGPPYKSKSV